MDGWLKSCKKQFTERIVARQNEATARVHTDLYGCFAFDPDKYARGYTRYVNGVLDYFKDRPQDLLVVDICGGEQNWLEAVYLSGKTGSGYRFSRNQCFCYSVDEYTEYCVTGKTGRTTGQQTLPRRIPGTRQTNPDTRPA